MIGDHLRLHPDVGSARIEEALAEDMLGVGDRVRARNNPGEISVEVAFEDAVICGRIRPAGAADQRSVAAILATRETRQTAPDALAIEQRLHIVHSNSPSPVCTTPTFAGAYPATCPAA
jgi:hypothetical protein